MPHLIITVSIVRKKWYNSKGVVTCISSEQEEPDTKMFH